MLSKREKNMLSRCSCDSVFSVRIQLFSSPPPLLVCVLGEFELLLYDTSSREWRVWKGKWKNVSCDGAFSREANEPFCKQFEIFFTLLLCFRFDGSKWSTRLQFVRLFHPRSTSEWAKAQEKTLFWWMKRKNLHDYVHFRSQAVVDVSLRKSDRNLLQTQIDYFSLFIPKWSCKLSNGIASFCWNGWKKKVFCNEFKSLFKLSESIFTH